MIVLSSASIWHDYGATYGTKLWEAARERAWSESHRRRSPWVCEAPLYHGKSLGCGEDWIVVNLLLSPAFCSPLPSLILNTLEPSPKAFSSSSSTSLAGLSRPRYAHRHFHCCTSSWLWRCLLRQLHSGLVTGSNEPISAELMSAISNSFTFSSHNASTPLHQLEQPIL